MDLSGQNPNTRIPHSEFHSLNGLRDWLRVYCINELGETRSAPPKFRIRNSASLHTQVGKTKLMQMISMSVSVIVQCLDLVSKVQINVGPNFCFYLHY